MEMPIALQIGFCIFCGSYFPARLMGIFGFGRYGMIAVVLGCVSAVTCVAIICLVLGPLSSLPVLIRTFYVVGFAYFFARSYQLVRQSLRNSEDQKKGGE